MNTPAMRARIGMMVIELLAFWSIAEGKVVYVAKTGSDANDGLSWATSKVTVQAGLNTAATGDEVWVAVGTYEGCITLKDGASLYGGFTGNETELVQRDWKASPTILDGNQAGSVVTAPSGATAATRIDGFTIRNGTGTLSDSYRYGGGIYCSSSSPAISNNTITGNGASFSGGGIYCSSSSSPTISNNTITGNSAGFSGGGISCSSSSTITNSTITGNRVTEANTIGGGGIYCYGGSPTITNNTITGNSASSSGGGIYCAYSSPTIANTIVAFNTSGILWLSLDTPSPRHTCVYGNIAYNYFGVADPTGTYGNISVDPQLLAADCGEVHLKAGSPCVDTGDDTVAPPGSADMDGEPRIQGTRVDIGADEFNGTQPSFTPRIVRVSPSGNDNNDGSSWELAKRTVQAGINATASPSSGEVWVAAGTYAERITLTLFFQVYGGFAGTETRRDQRDWVSHVTILDGNVGGSVVSVSFGSVLSAVDGFTIRNGKAPLGGGIYCSSSSPTIMNNTITRNSVTGSNACGGGVYCSSSSPTITNNTITGNSAAGSNGYGGGIYCSRGSPRISNNTITVNTATYGGGIYCESSSPTIANTIVAFNTSGIDLPSSNTPSLRYNCVYGNAAYNFYGVADPTGTNGNISVDPQLLAADCGEVHLKAGSPCVDAGDDTVVPPGSVDMDGEPRVQGTQVDIGADEFNGTQPSFTPKIVRVSPSGNDNNDGSSWELAKRTVQAGINATASPNGGEVWVAAGTYAERITLTLFFQVYGGFTGTETRRDQRDWVSHVTILDGTAGGSVVSVSFGTVLSAIDGFTIRNGKAFYGGGIYCSSSSLTIANNTITRNSVTGSSACGGGVYCSSSSPTIINNTITENSATGGTTYGGGIYCSGGSQTISSNTIIGNTTTYGGGIYCSTSSQTITNNIIRGNAVLGTGGGLSFKESSPTITNNAISENTALSGGGIYCVYSSATVKNNIVTGNHGYRGGGIHSNGSSLLIANNTITGNAAQSGGGYYGYSTPATIVNTIIAFNSSGLIDYGGTPSLRSNCVYGNTDYDYSGLTDPTGTNGNISIDPELAGPFHGNIHIQPDSPCVDVGDDTVAESGSTDMDGQARIAGPHVDIGVDESDGTVWPVGPSIIVRVSPEGSDTNDGASWASAKLTVQAAIDTAAPAGGDVWVRAGVYPERITIPSHVHLYGGFDGAETQVGQRDWRAHASILDGQAGGSVVTATRPGYLLCTIDGFTIRNGNATEGGGINCRYSSPMITHNTITGNNAFRGGGILCSSSSLVIAENAIAGNTSSQGAGIWCMGDASRIVNNTIRRNSAADIGGGIYASGIGMVLNNTITENVAVSAGGIYMESVSSNMVVANTIVAFNSSGLFLRRGSGPSMRTNCVFGNTAYNYNSMTDPTGTDGNIAADPLFVHSPAPGDDGVWATADDDQGDLHLMAGSPCIDAGDNGAVPTGILTDMDGMPRFLNDPATTDTGLGTAPIVDIGAYEYIPGDMDRDGDIDADDLKVFAACISGPAIPYASDCAGADFDKDGDVDQSDFGFIQRCFSGAGKAVDPACGD